MLAQDNPNPCLAQLCIGSNSVQKPALVLKTKENWSKRNLKPLFQIFRFVVFWGTRNWAQFSRSHIASSLYQYCENQKITSTLPGWLAFQKLVYTYMKHDFYAPDTLSSKRLCDLWDCIRTQILGTLLLPLCVTHLEREHSLGQFWGRWTNFLTSFQIKNKNRNEIYLI